MNKRRLQVFSALAVAGVVLALGLAAGSVAAGRLRATMERQIARDSAIISQNLRILIRQATRELANREAAVDRIQGILEEMQVKGWQGFACVIDEEGRILAHPSSGMQGHRVDLDAYAPTDLGHRVEAPPAALVGPETRDPAVYRTEADIIAIQWLPDLMTYLCVHQPQDEVSRRLSDLFGIVSRLGAAFLVMSSIGAWFFVGMLVDRYETRLSRSETRNRALVENSDPIWVVDRSGRLIAVNASGSDLLGAPSDALVGRPVTDFCRAEDAGRMQDLLAAFEGTGTRTRDDLAVRPVDGRSIPVHVRACGIDYDDRPAVYLLLRDITESVRARNEMEEANRRLRELDRLKSDFLNTVSHELRTPLTSIKWSAESMAALEANWDPATFSRLLAIIRDDNQRLSRLIEQLLSFSRIDAGKLQPRREPADLGSLVRAAVDELANAAERKAITLSSPSNTATVHGDPDQLRQVLTNLLDNAVKYTPEGGRVRVDLETSGGRAVLSVHDSGIGIPADEHQRIFERFYRVDREDVRGESGTGLGLAIVSGIVTAHEGTVTVESTPGEGSTFRVTLPLAS